MISITVVFIWMIFNNLRSVGVEELRIFTFNVQFPKKKLLFSHFPIKRSKT